MPTLAPPVSTELSHEANSVTANQGRYGLFQLNWHRARCRHKLSRSAHPAREIDSTMPPYYVPGLHRPVSVSEYATLTGGKGSSGLRGDSRAQNSRSVRSRSVVRRSAAELRSATCSTAYSTTTDGSRSGNARTKKEGGLADWVRELGGRARSKW